MEDIISDLSPGLPDLVAFDLDDTLAPSKSALPPQMRQVLRRLLQLRPVCVISGGNLTQFQTQLLDHLAAEPEELRNLHLMPTCGTRYLQYVAGEWSLNYAHDLTEVERAEAAQVLQEEAERLGLWESKTWGPILEDRGSQITFSALGQQAPLSAKKNWDPTGAKKEKLRAAVAERLPKLEVRSGGATSIDITRKGVDKSYAMSQLVAATNIPGEKMLFIGDRLDPGGNDRPVLDAGYPCRAVSGWEETVSVIGELLEALSVE